ncbi:MAG: segregation/condensation protein A [Lachnospiraceae bacterium]|nr:segregation/condensation protein A [Lachnospiraceae bacterium]
MNPNYKLEAFEGPLDLLLALIEKNKINIYDIPIVEITEQYLEYVSSMDTDDMDYMSDFIVEAATLVRIKSKMMLPVSETDAEGEEIDPRAELVERLLEYKMYKYISGQLKDKQLDASKYLFKHSTIPDEVRNYKEEIDVGELLEDVTLSKLKDIFNDLVKKKEDRIDPVRSKFGKIVKEDTDIRKTIYDLQNFGLKNRTFMFRSYMEKLGTKTEMIISFLAILELIRMERIKIKQDELFGDIRIDYLADDIAPLEELALT